MNYYIELLVTAILYCGFATFTDVMNTVSFPPLAKYVQFLCKSSCVTDFCF